MSALVSVLLRSWWRFFITGQPLRGQPKDNATLFHAANQDNSGRPYEKFSGPRWRRLAWHWGVLGVPLLLMAMSVVARAVRFASEVDPWWALHDWFHMALRWWIVGGLTVLGYGIYRLHWWLKWRRVIHDFIKPTWRAACEAMGHPYRESEAWRMVELPDDYRPMDAPELIPRNWLMAKFYNWRDARRLARDLEEADRVAAWLAEDAEDSEDIAELSTELVRVESAGELDTYKPYPSDGLPPKRAPAADIEEEPVRITLIPGKCTTEAKQKAFKATVGPVLGMKDPRARWYLTGHSPYVELLPNQPPPPELTFDQFKRHLGAATVDKVPIGITHGNKVAYINFLLDTAHVLISAASGTGKTNLIKFVAALFMHLGASLVVLDFKVISHRWAHKLRGCDYAWNIPMIHELLEAIGKEIQKRKDSVMEYVSDVDRPLDPFNMLIVIVEEQNALADQLRAYWTSIRKPNQPAQSPALAALQEVVFTGREFNVRVFSVAQMANAATWGTNGGAARESYAVRILGGWTIQAWKMLAGGLPFVRCPSSREFGRGIFALLLASGEMDIVRVPFITDRQAKDLALSGVPCQGQGNRGIVGEEVITVTQDGVPVKAAELPPPSEVTLREAVEGNMLPGPAIKQEALRKAIQRDLAAGKPTPDVAGWRDGAVTYSLPSLRAWKDARDGKRPMPVLMGTSRGGAIYKLDTLKPDAPTFEIEIGYVGKSRRFPLSIRANEHDGDKPFSDLVQSMTIVWQSDSCTDIELSQAEQDAIHQLKPRYNYEFQEGAEHAMPLWEQKRQRQLRQQALGLPPWEPEDRYAMSQMSQRPEGAVTRDFAHSSPGQPGQD